MFSSVVHADTGERGFTKPTDYLSSGDKEASPGSSKRCRAILILMDELSQEQLKLLQQRLNRI